MKFHVCLVKVYFFEFGKVRAEQAFFEDESDDCPEKHCNEIKTENLEKF